MITVYITIYIDVQHTHVATNNESAILSSVFFASTWQWSLTCMDARGGLAAGHLNGVTYFVSLPAKHLNSSFTHWLCLALMVENRMHFYALDSQRAFHVSWKWSQLKHRDWMAIGMNLDCPASSQSKPNRLCPQGARTQTLQALRPLQLHLRRKTVLRQPCQAIQSQRAPAAPQRWQEGKTEVGIRSLMMW